MTGKISKKEFCVMVTSVGSAPAIGVIKGLKKSEDIKVKIVGLDSDPLAVGFSLCDASHTGPPAQNEDFMPAVKAIALSNDVSVIFPVLEDELSVFSDAEPSFLKEKIKLIINGKDVLATCFDKLKLYEICNAQKMPVPSTFSAAELSKADMDFPVVLKKRYGRRFEDVVIAYSPDNLLATLRAKNYELVGQRLIIGKEYTAEVLCGQNNKRLVTVIRERLQTKAGVCVKARFVHHKAIEELVDKLLGIFTVRGPFNIQIIETKDGSLYIIDVNPKFAGGGGLTVTGGVNIPLLFLKAALSIKYRATDLNYKEGVIVGSYYTEAILSAPAQMSAKAKGER